MNKLSILVPSCDNYSDLWLPFFECFFKYWPCCPYQVYLGVNYKDFFYPGVSVIKAGKDIGYSKILIKYLNTIKSENVLFWIEDRFLARTLDQKKILYSIEYFEKNNLDFLKIISGHPYSYPESNKYIFSPLSVNERYWVCLTVALWKKSTLLKIADLGKTAWELEKKGTLFAKHKSLKFYSLSYAKRTSPIIIDQHIIIKGKLLRDSVSFLDQEGLLNSLQNRNLQTRFNAFYVFLYKLFFNILGLIKNFIVNLNDAFL